MGFRNPKLWGWVAFFTFITVMSFSSQKGHHMTGVERCVWYEAEGTYCGNR